MRQITQAEHHGNVTSTIGFEQPGIQIQSTPPVIHAHPQPQHWNQFIDNQAATTGAANLRNQMEVQNGPMGPLQPMMPRKGHRRSVVFAVSPVQVPPPQQDHVPYQQVSLQPVRKYSIGADSMQGQFDSFFSSASQQNSLNSYSSGTPGTPTKGIIRRDSSRSVGLTRADSNRSVGFSPEDLNRPAGLRRVESNRSTGSEAFSRASSAGLPVPVESWTTSGPPVPQEPVLVPVFTPINDVTRLASPTNAGAPRNALFFGHEPEAPLQKTAHRNSLFFGHEPAAITPKKQRRGSTVFPAASTNTIYTNDLSNGANGRRGTIYTNDTATVMVQPYTSGPSAEILTLNSNQTGSGGSSPSQARDASPEEDSAGPRSILKRADGPSSIGNNAIVKVVVDDEIIPERTASDGKPGSRRRSSIFARLTGSGGSGGADYRRRSSVMSGLGRYLGDRRASIMSFGSIEVDEHGKRRRSSVFGEFAGAAVRRTSMVMEKFDRIGALPGQLVMGKTRGPKKEVELRDHNCSSLCEFCGRCACRVW